MPHDLLLESAQNLDVWYDEKSISYRKNGKLLWHPCPYGQPGDVLWVRESYMNMPREGFYQYKATHPNFSQQETRDKILKEEGLKWKPSIHMPRSACRLFLKVEKLRGERLQDISWVDAICEGLEYKPDKKLPLYRDYTQKKMITDRFPHNCFTDPRISFRSLWDIINGSRASWESNPWVWAVEFSRIENYSK